MGIELEKSTKYIPENGIKYNLNNSFLVHNGRIFWGMKDEV